jgi:hypothetical protein
MVQEIQARLELNGTRQLFSCAHDANLLGDNAYTINESGRTLIEDIRREEIALEINVDK